MPDIFVAPPKTALKTEENSPIEASVSEISQMSPEREMTVPQETPKKNPSPVAALMINPVGVNFQTQDKDEQVVLLFRRHWVTNFPWIFFGSLMLLAPFVLSVFTPFLPLQLPTQILISGVIFWYLLAFGYFLINFLLWYFNAYLITNERIVDIDFYNLVYKEVSSARLGNIEDVTFKVGGVIRHIFDYGDIFIQTAGQEANFEFQAVPKPALIADRLDNLMESLGKTE